MCLSFDDGVGSFGICLFVCVCVLNGCLSVPNRGIAHGHATLAGSVPVEKIQNILRCQHRDLYDKVVGSKHRSWNKFTRRPPPPPLFLVASLCIEPSTKMNSFCSLHKDPSKKIMMFIPTCFSTFTPTPQEPSSAKRFFCQYVRRSVICGL